MKADVEKVVGGWRGGEGGWRCGEDGWWLALWLVQNNDSKRKMATSKITARVTRIIPFKHRWGNLSEHRLIDITDLRTYMVVCEFPQP